MRTVEDVVVSRRSLKLKRYLLRKNVSGSFGGEEIHERLRRNVFGLSSPHDNEGDGFLARFGNTLNRKMQSQFNVLSPSTTKVLELQDDPEIFSVHKCSSGTTRIEENIRPFCQFERKVSNVRAFLGGVSKLFQIRVVLPHPLFMFAEHAPLQPSEYRQHAREYYEQGVVYFLYSLCPVLFLMGIGGHLALRNPCLLRKIFGNGLVCGGFLYLFLGILFVGSGLLL